MAGSNTIEFRYVKLQLANGTPVGEKWQYRTKDTVINILGVSLGSWSDWTDTESNVATLTVPG